MPKVTTLFAILAASALAPAAAHAHTVKPLKILIVSGGGYHDYPAQRRILEEGLKQRINATISHAFYDPKPGDQGTRPALPIHANPRYADGYDLVIHNQCAADEDSAAVLESVLAPHRAGTPGVNLHCAMHSYRSGTWRQPVKAGERHAQWFEYTGIQSSGHGPQLPIRLAAAPGEHPVARGFVPYDTGKDELYNNLTVFNVTPVLTGTQPDAEKPEERVRAVHVAWTHHYGPRRARVFSTTLAHNESNMADPRYLDLLARGVLWAAGRLDDK